LIRKYFTLQHYLKIEELKNRFSSMLSTERKIKRCIT